MSPQYASHWLQEGAQQGSSVGFTVTASHIIQPGFGQLFVVLTAQAEGVRSMELSASSIIFLI